MTRSEVARALKRSLSTVRRIEGVFLHPRKDARGVHQFDPREVRQLQRAVANQSVSLASEWFKQRSNATTAPHALARENRALREALALTVTVARSVCRHRLSRDIETLLDDAEELAYG